MKYYNEMTLKDGRRCVLRSPDPEDAAEVLEHLRQTSGETDNMLRYPDEITMTAEDEAKYLAGLLQSPDAVLIVAEIDGVLAAAGGFNPVAPVYKCRHRAEFGISVKERFWGLGVGRAVTEAAVSEAVRAGYELLELSVLTKNSRAVSLYRKQGFRIYGLLNGGFRRRDGGYDDLYLMSLKLTEGI